MVIMVILLALIFLQLCALCSGDDPKYVASMERMFSYSRNQTFILDTWPLQHATWNAAIANFVFDPRFAQSGNTERRWREDPLFRVPLLVMWSNKWYVLDANVSRHRERYLPHSLPLSVNGTAPPRMMSAVESAEKNTMAGRADFSMLHPLKDLGRAESGNDLRLFLFRNELRFHRVESFSDVPGGRSRYGLVLGRFLWNNETQSLFVRPEDERRLLIDHEMGKRPEKNWTPFQFDYTVMREKPSGKDKEKERGRQSIRRRLIAHETPGEVTAHSKNNDNSMSSLSVVPALQRFSDRYFNYSAHKHIRSAQLYVYSIEPHRIVYAQPSTPTPNDTARENVFPFLNMTTVALTRFVPSPSRPVFWTLGNPHGSTPAVLVHTRYGPKYLSFFHSQGKYLISYILTYFVGAYLFDATPPFAISHMTPDPLVPNAWYNETFGWSFRAIDYILFPMGFVVRDDLVILTSGRNDRSAWIATFNLTGLVDYMIPIKTEVLVDSLNDTLKREHSSSSRQTIFV